jgi:hypothetical protein
MKPKGTKYPPDTREPSREVSLIGLETTGVLQISANVEGQTFRKDIF